MINIPTASSVLRRTTQEITGVLTFVDNINEKALGNNLEQPVIIINTAMGKEVELGGEVVGQAGDVLITILTETKGEGVTIMGEVLANARDYGFYVDSQGQTEQKEIGKELSELRLKTTYYNGLPYDRDRGY